MIGVNLLTGRMERLSITNSKDFFPKYVYKNSTKNMYIDFLDYLPTYLLLLEMICVLASYY